MRGILLSSIQWTIHKQMVASILFQYMSILLMYSKSFLYQSSLNQFLVSFDMSMGMPTSAMICLHIYIYFSLNVFTGFDWGVHRMILEMIKYFTLHI